MSLELDPILEETIREVHSNINNITSQKQPSVVLKWIISVYTVSHQWLEYVRFPSVLERAAAIIVKLSQAQENFTSAVHSLSQDKHNEYEASVQFITNNIIKKLNLFKEELKSQTLNVNKLIKNRANYKDIEIEEERLAYMIDNAKLLLHVLNENRIDLAKLEHWVQMHESQENLSNQLKSKLQNYVSQLGFVPTESFSSNFIQALKSEDCAKKLQMIWKTAKTKVEAERTLYIEMALDTFIAEHQETLNKNVFQALSARIENGKQQIKLAIEAEYDKIPAKIRYVYDIFQNSIYYSAEWECNRLIADLHLCQRSVSEVQTVFDSLMKKWNNPRNIKRRFCRALEQDWNICHSALKQLYLQYKNQK